MEFIKKVPVEMLYNGCFVGAGIGCTLLVKNGYIPKIWGVAAFGLTWAGLFGTTTCIIDSLVSSKTPELMVDPIAREYMNFYDKLRPEWHESVEQQVKMIKGLQKRSNFRKFSDGDLELTNASIKFLEHLKGGPGGRMKSASCDYYESDDEKPEKPEDRKKYISRVKNLLLKDWDKQCRKIDLVIRRGEVEKNLRGESEASGTELKGAISESTRAFIEEFKLAEIGCTENSKSAEGGSLLLQRRKKRGQGTVTQASCFIKEWNNGSEFDDLLFQMDNID